MALKMPKETDKKLKLIIEYIADFEYLDTQRLLDELRSYGEANIIDIEIVEPDESTS